MPAARYWRAVGIESYSGDGLELSELHLYDAGGRVDTLATLTCSHTPAAGVLANINDDDTATTVRWLEPMIRAPGFAFVWDFGVGVTKTCTGVRVGSSPDRARFLAGLTLEYFDGSRWVLLSIFNRFPWPGVSAMGEGPTGASIYAAAILAHSPLMYHRLNEPGGSTFADASGSGRDGTQFGAVTKSSAALIGGNTASIYIPSSGGMAAAWPFGSSYTGPWSQTIIFRRDSAPATVGDGFFAGFSNNVADWSGIFCLDPNLAVRGLTVYGSTGIDAVGTPGQYALGTTAVYVFTCEPGVGIKVYLNASLAASNSSVSGVLRYADSGVIVGGAAGSFGSAFYLSDHAVFNKALTASEISDLYAAAVGIGAPGGQVFDPPRLRTTQRTLDTFAAYNNPGSVRAAATGQLRLAHDLEFGGPGRVWGTTKVKGTPNLPTKARVVLLHQRSKVVARETWSDPATGAFSFDGIDTRQEFITLAEDAAGLFRPVAANKLVPEMVS